MVFCVVFMVGCVFAVYWFPYRFSGLRELNGSISALVMPPYQGCDKYIEGMDSIVLRLYILTFFPFSVSPLLGKWWFILQSYIYLSFSFSISIKKNWWLTPAFFSVHKPSLNVLFSTIYLIEILLFLCCF